jgi:hypothetical protein
MLFVAKRDETTRLFFFFLTQLTGKTTHNIALKKKLLSCGPSKTPRLAALEHMLRELI